LRRWLVEVAAIVARAMEEKTGGEPKSCSHVIWRIGQ